MNSLTLDLFDALYGCTAEDLCRGASELFRVLGYPADDSSAESNVNAGTFVYLIAENQVVFSQDELLTLNSVKTISLLFTVDGMSGCCSDTRRDEEPANSIVFVAVDMEERPEQRSQTASYLTAIISKCFNSPIFVLFRNDDSLMFAGQVAPMWGEDSADIYLSDWMCTSEPQLDDLERMGGLLFEYVNFSNLVDMYFNILFAISRKYQIFSESFEFLEWGLYFDEYSPYSYFRYKGTMLNVRSLTDTLELKRTYYQRLYSTDYVPRYNFDDSLSVVHKVDLYQDEIDLIQPEDNLFDVSDYDGAEDYEQDIDDIDDSYFDDPILLLQLLDEKQSK